MNSNKHKSKKATGEDTYAGALRAGSPACVFAFVLIYVHYELQMNDLQMKRCQSRIFGRSTLCRLKAKIDDATAKRQCVIYQIDDSRH